MRVKKVNIDIYILKYIMIIKILIKKNIISKFNWNIWFLKKLLKEIQLKIFEYYNEKKWKILKHDMKIMKLNFKEIKEIILKKIKILK